MQIGAKYIHPDRPTPMVFIGFTAGGKGRFILDNQALFDLLGEPYSVDAIARFANTSDLDDIGAPCTVETSDTKAWISQGDVDARIAELETLLSATTRLRNLFREPTIYATDMPGGETYNSFIREFKARCKAAGVNTDSYTFHGMEGTNQLSVCHNDYEKTGEDCFTPDDEVFLTLKREPQYARLRVNYMYATGAPKLIDY